jgi:hypothetical protein
MTETPVCLGARNASASEVTNSIPPTLLVADQKSARNSGRDTPCSAQSSRPNHTGIFEAHRAYYEQDDTDGYQEPSGGSCPALGETYGLISWEWKTRR